MLPARRLVVEPALSSVVVYHYPACGTCRSALAFLRARGVAHDLVDIVKDPPSAALLEEALARSGLPLRRLFNTSGVSYREGGFKDRVDTDPREALLGGARARLRTLHARGERAERWRASTYACAAIHTSAAHASVGDATAAMCDHTHAGQPSR